MQNTQRGAPDISIEDIRKACRQFAMLYFHFCRTLVETLGEEAALQIVQRTVYRLSLDRTDRLRDEAAAAGVPFTLEGFNAVTDLPYRAWTEWRPEDGGVRCPYAQFWLNCFGEHPWFKKFASLYCDVIDTTNIENFTRDTSHRITKNLLWGDDECDREYFPCAGLIERGYTYDPDSSLDSAK